MYFVINNNKAIKQKAKNPTQINKICCQMKIPLIINLVGPVTDKVLFSRSTV